MEGDIGLLKASTARSGLVTADERERRLSPVVERYRFSPFEWGRHDCVLFAARCVDAQCGSRFEQRIRSEFRYTTAMEALRLIKQSGGFESVVTQFLGPMVPPGELELGDVVLGRGPGQFADCVALGICDEESFMVPDHQGLAWLSMNLARGGWHCPLAEAVD